MAAASSPKAPGRTGRNGNVKKTYVTGLPVPNEIKKLRGTYHERNDKPLAAKKRAEAEAKKRGESTQESAPLQLMECSDKDLAIPDSLVFEESRKEWTNFVVPMAKAGIIQISDLRIAEIYCDMWGCYSESRNLVHETIESQKRGEPVMVQNRVFPLKLAKELAKILAQMGMTPVSRAKVVAYARLPARNLSKDDWGDILNAD